LWRELAQEWASWCGTSTALDYKKLESRVEAEGESFLTITLPSFDKGLTQSLEQGSVGHGFFPGFDLRRSGLPRFLAGFLDQIFDDKGALLDVPSIDCIAAVHHLTTVFGKIRRLCSEERIADAMRQYVQIEQELAEIDTSSLEELLPRFRKASTLLWADVFTHVENSVLDTHHLAHDWLAHLGDEPQAQAWSFTSQGLAKHVDPMDVLLGLPPHVPHAMSFDYRAGERTDEFVDCKIVDPSSVFTFAPRHGPGATADRLRGNAKYSVGQWPRRLESVFPYGDYALPPGWWHDHQLDRVQFLEPGAEVPVKVTPVPKTDKTARVIAEEPTAMQYCQQGVFLQFVYCLENPDKTRPPYGGKRCNFGVDLIGLKYQEPNRLLALKGSQDGFLATLDLSEASDRVLNEHVLLLFERFPRLSAAIQATRSTKALVPGYGEIPLAKFSSMGSALCFPVEAMVFSTIIVLAIQAERKVPLDRAFLESLRGQVRVYGDDIIVPVDCVQRVMAYLEAFGLKVNKSKSFWNGKFRESCGGDFYDGERVTPIRLRRELPRSLADANEVVSLVAFRNLLYSEGFWTTAGYLDHHLDRLLKRRWKIVESTSTGLGRLSVSFKPMTEYQDGKLQQPMIHGVVATYRTPKSLLDGFGALQKYHLKRGVLPSEDREHLARAGRAEVAHIKLRGIRPY
jgi:hypothetical protein